MFYDSNWHQSKVEFHFAFHSAFHLAFRLPAKLLPFNGQSSIEIRKMVKGDSRDYREPQPVENARLSTQKKS